MAHDKMDLKLPIVLLLILIQAVLIIRLDWSTSPNRTEMGHMAATLRLWKTGTFDVFHVNPPLTRIIAGLPVIALEKPNCDWSGYSSDPSKRCEWELGIAFIKANTSEKSRFCFFVARSACLPLILI